MPDETFWRSGPSHKPRKEKGASRSVCYAIDSLQAIRRLQPAACTPLMPYLTALHCAAARQGTARLP